MSEELLEDFDTEDEENEEDSTPLPKPNVSGRAAENPAVARCCDAYTTAFMAAFADDPEDEFDARSHGKDAYRKALPPLSGNRNIRDFIACVAYGILIEAIDDSRGTRLLYAAQVAHTMRRTKSKRLKSTPGTD
jgi:hypothetical protein